MIDNNEIILLPKGYLSWSQCEIWEKSPERYKKEYFTDGSKLDTDALRFGKFIASSIERYILGFQVHCYIYLHLYGR